MTDNKLKTYLRNHQSATPGEPPAGPSRKRSGRTKMIWIGGLSAAGILYGLGSLAGSESPDAAPPAAGASAPAPGKPELAVDAEALWERYKALAAPCDEVAKAVAVAFRAEDATPYSTYPVVSRAHDTCRAQWLKIGALTPPADAEDETRKGFEAAIEMCTVSYGARAESFKGLKKMLDGDGRPSLATQIEEQQQMAEYGLSQCVPQLMSLVSQVGGSLPELELAAKQNPD